MRVRHGVWLWRAEKRHPRRRFGSDVDRRHRRLFPDRRAAEPSYCVDAGLAGAVAIAIVLMLNPTVDRTQQLAEALRALARGGAPTREPRRVRGARRRRARAQQECAAGVVDGARGREPRAREVAASSHVQEAARATASRSVADARARICQSPGARTRSLDEEEGRPLLAHHRRGDVRSHRRQRTPN